MSSGRRSDPRRRRGRIGIAAVLAAALGAGVLPAAPRSGSGRASGATRADLDAVRRTVAQLECERALGLTLKPYLVLDLGARILRYRLMGMTMREVTIDRAEARGLRSAAGTATPDPTSAAAVFTLREKEGDPRLSPLTPEQIEAGLDDENAADVLPPEPPAAYALAFRQPVVLRILGAPPGGGIGGSFAALAAWWHGLRHSDRRRGDPRPALEIALRLDPGAAGEIYRSLVPGERFLVLAPSGLLLPAAGQEPARAIRPARPTPTPAPPPQPPAPGVPFQIPPPLTADQGPPGAALTPAAGAPEPAPPADAAPVPAPTPSVPGDSSGSKGEEEPTPAERIPETPAP